MTTGPTFPSERKAAAITSPLRYLAGLLGEIRISFRSLLRTPGFSVTVALTLALGIGVNAAIFTIVRGVLLRPLVNRDETNLIFIRQSAPGLQVDNATFSVPEIQDITAHLKTISKLATFSTVDFTIDGFGPPRTIRAGVVDGPYFDVMGLRPVLGRLLDSRDDGGGAAGAAVLTYKFWATTVHSDPNVLGKTIRLGSMGGSRSAVIVGVLEPSIPYPAETEIIANIVTSPHHLSATMVTMREHRMTDIFGRLAPGATLASARAELRTVYSVMTSAHPEVYKSPYQYRIDALRLRDQINSRASMILWLLFAASGLLFVIACSNVANLMLARIVRRESELALRIALGGSTVAIRRSLLAEGLVLCGGGGLAGVLVAAPMVTVLARFVLRYSVRAANLTVDFSVLWAGLVLAFGAAVFLAFVPRLPSPDTSRGLGLAAGSGRITRSSRRRIRVFAVIQIAASFLSLASAGVLLTTLLALQKAQPGFETGRVLVANLPLISDGRTPQEVARFYEDAQRSVSALPGVEGAVVGMGAPWRDSRFLAFTLQFAVEGMARQNGNADLRARFRFVSPGYPATLGIPLLDGRDFTEADRMEAEPVVIVSKSVAQRFFSGQDAINRHIMWTDPVMKFIDVSPAPRRIVGVAADVDDQHVVPGPALTVYHPFDQQELWGGRLFVHTHQDPYALVTPITQLIRQMSAEQPVERAATLADVRAEVLTPDRLNTLVFGGFAAVALAIAVVGVAGVLAFSVNGRTREFGIRLALGSNPRRLLSRVIAEGVVMAAVGVAAGLGVGYGLARLAARYLADLQMPSLGPVAGSAVVLLAAAVVASVWPAARAGRVDVVEALRAE